jgi:hypothetical protein
MRNVLIAISLSFLAACGTENSQGRSDESAALIAMAPSTTDTPAGPGAQPRPAAHFPEEILRDPAERFRLIERLRIEVVSKTRAVPEARWLGELRPALRGRLTSAGLAPADADFLLAEIDQARGHHRP